MTQNNGIVQEKARLPLVLEMYCISQTRTQVYTQGREVTGKTYLSTNTLVCVSRVRAS